jgi:hypothetical protein
VERGVCIFLVWWQACVISVLMLLPCCCRIGILNGYLHDVSSNHDVCVLCNNLDACCSGVHCLPCAAQQCWSVCRVQLHICSAVWAAILCLGVSLACCLWTGWWAVELLQQQA